MGLSAASSSHAFDYKHALKQTYSLSGAAIDIAIACLIPMAIRHKMKHPHATNDSRLGLVALFCASIHSSDRLIQRAKALIKRLNNKKQISLKVEM